MSDQRSLFRCNEENSVFILADSLTLSFVTPRIDPTYSLVFQPRATNGNPLILSIWHPAENHVRAKN